MPFQEVELEENFFVSLISEAALDSTGGSNKQQNYKKKKIRRGEQECSTKGKEGIAATSSKVSSAMETHLQGRSISWFTWDHFLYIDKA